MDNAPLWMREGAGDLGEFGLTVLDLEVEHGQAEFAEVARPLSHP
jgi:hypothetical protein